MLEWAQPLFYLVGILSAVFGIPRYFRTSRQRMAETFIELEDRFAQHRPIRRMIDPAADESAPLIEAVRNSLDGIPRSTPERQLLTQLDDFLRFLLLLSRLQKNALVSSEALAYMYYYWFNAVRDTPDLWRYVQQYFPMLQNFMNEYAADFREFALKAPGPQMKS
jgi:hypothetical protein